MGFVAIMVCPFTACMPFILGAPWAYAKAKSMDSNQLAAATLFVIPLL
eukprot:SAG22_NODE_4428_length_1272_cov_1.474851_1_plen_47_part_10